jgi:hypothetical protein
MNCHRNLDSLTTADFPDIASFLIESSPGDKIDQQERAISVHTIFTEMDHGYVNPVSDKYPKQIEDKFDYKKWDRNSGYEDSDCFNEYMTWALYDLFTAKYFPKDAQYINTQWHYQNSTRGFFASSLFAAKLMELYNKTSGKELEEIYPKVLDWCAAIKDSLSFPTLILPRKNAVYPYDAKAGLAITFSEPMKKDFDTLNIYVAEIQKGKSTNRGEMLALTPKDIKWQGNTMLIPNKINFAEFSLIFNWWGIAKPVLSEKGVMLAAQSYIDYKTKGK